MRLHAFALFLFFFFYWRNSPERRLLPHWLAEPDESRKEIETQTNCLQTGQAVEGDLYFFFKKEDGVFEPGHWHVQGMNNSQIKQNKTE